MNLTPVQLEAIVRADGRKHFAYYMEMGLGKTLAVLTEFKVLKRCGTVDKLVVIAPNSFKSGWAAEIEKHKLGLSYAIHQSGRAMVDTDVDVLIVNYEALLIDRVRWMIDSFIDGKRGYIAFDESIKLKNRKAKTTKVALKLAPVFAFVRLLSGKPITQGPHDLWSQLALLNAEQYTYYGFQARFCMLGGWQGKQVVGSLNEDLLAEQIAPVTFQAKKKDWLRGLPPKLYTIRRYEMAGRVREHYEMMKEEFLTFLDSGEAVTVAVAIAKYEKLSQIQCGFIIDEQGVTQSLVWPDENPRLQLLLDILKEEVTGPAIVVYRHRAVGEMLRTTLGRPAWIRGGMRSEEIRLETDLFNSGAMKLMLLQADAGKYGHTLIGPSEDPCGTMIFFENSYSLDTRAQVEDRIHRQGATAESCLYVDLAGSSYDAAVVAALQRKEQMFLKVFKESA